MLLQSFESHTSFRQFKDDYETANRSWKLNGSGVWKDARFAEFELGSARTSPEPPATTPRATGVTGVAAKRSELAGV